MAGRTDPKIVVALDFGTYGSGFAWALISHLDSQAESRRINYSHFPGWTSAGYPKNLSAVLVDSEGRLREWGHQARRDWVAALTNGNPQNLGYAARFKMSIRADAHQVDVPEYGGSLSAPRRAEVTQLVVHVLRQLRDMVLKQIADASTSVGGQVVGYVEDDIIWCVTIPAIWEDSDKELMRQAAIRAGLPDDDRLILAIEPEAAAVYCAFHEGTNLDPDRSVGRLNLGIVGTRFVVVDCGGGTVDITGYRVSLADGSRHGLTEIGIPDGGKLGSEYVNEAFRTGILGRRFGRDRVEHIRREFPDELLQMEETWENEKLHAPAATDSAEKAVIERGFSIPIPVGIWQALSWNTKRKIKSESGGPRLKITPEEVQSAFDGVIDEIVAKVEAQLAIMRRDGDEHARILLVGGFAEAGYLRLRIAQHFGSQVTVLAPLEPAKAVLAGAVRFARDPSVVWARRAKYTYGFGLALPFEPRLDPSDRMFLDSEQEKMCRNRFWVAVKRGETIPIDQIPRGLTVWPVHEQLREITLKMFATTAADPRYIDQPGCTEIGNVAIDVSDTVGRPRHERHIDVRINAGRTTFEVVATKQNTQQEVRTEVVFEERYPR
jgi:hypothetical protein